MATSITIDFVYDQKTYQANLQPMKRQNETQYEIISIDPALKDLIDGDLFFTLKDGFVIADDAQTTGEAAPLRRSIAEGLENYLLTNSGWILDAGYFWYLMLKIQIHLLD